MTVDTLGSTTAAELDDVGMWTLVVGVTAAILGDMSGAILVGLTAAHGVVASGERKDLWSIVRAPDTAWRLG